MKPSEHELILKEVAKCVCQSDWAIYEENGKCHISSACFETPFIKLIVRDLLAIYVEKAGTASVVGFSEGIDQAVISFTTGVALKLGKPFFKYMMSEVEAIPEIRSNLANCTLLLSYTSYKEQILEILQLIEKQGGYARQLITLVDEREQAEEICKSKRIDFKAVTSLADIIDSLRTLPSTDKKKLDAIVKRLQQD